MYTTRHVHWIILRRTQNRSVWRKELKGVVEQRTTAAERVSHDPSSLCTAHSPARLAAPPPRGGQLGHHVDPCTEREGGAYRVDRAGNAVAVAEVADGQRARSRIHTSAGRSDVLLPRPRGMGEAKVESAPAVLLEELHGLRRAYDSLRVVLVEVCRGDETTMGVGQVGVGDAERGGGDIVHDRGVPEGCERQEGTVRLALDDIDALAVGPREASNAANVAVVAACVAVPREERYGVLLDADEIADDVVEEHLRRVDVEVSRNPWETEEDGQH